jgi:hypothetical protein
VNPGERDSFEVIFDLLRGIDFKIKSAVDSWRVSEFLSQVGREFGADGSQSLPVGAAGPTRRIECPAFKTVMKKGLFGKEKPVQVPAMKKGNAKVWRAEVEIDVPDGIIEHLTRECGGNVDDRHIVKVTSGSFEKETEGASAHSGACDCHDLHAAKNVADLETGSCFLSAYRGKKVNIRHKTNN